MPNKDYQPGSNVSLFSPDVEDDFILGRTSGVEIEDFPPVMVVYDTNNFSRALPSLGGTQTTFNEKWKICVNS